MRLQTLSAAGVRNLTPFGSALRAAARQLLEARGPLPGFLACTGHGFQDGGCQVFAQAVHIWSGGAFRPMAACAAQRGGRPQHIFVGACGVALDSDGMATCAEMCAKMTYFEGQLGFSAAPYEWGASEAIPIDPAESALLAALLKEGLGPFAPGLLLRGVQPRLLGHLQRVAESLHKAGDGVAGTEDHPPPRRP